MKTSSSLFAASVFALFATSAFGSQNVFDDAAFWFRGGKDCVTADGQLQTGEFFDDLHAADGSHANHWLEVTGYAENGTFRTEDVVFPALGTAFSKPMQVLHVTDNTKDGKRCPLYVRPLSLFANNSISNEYTIICRIRLDTLSRLERLFRIGYQDGNAKKGLLLGFNEHTERPGCKYVTAWMSQSTGASMTEVAIDRSNLFFPTNTWVDMSVAVGNGKLRVGLAAPDSKRLSNDSKTPTIHFAEVNMWTDNCTLMGTGWMYRLFGEGGSGDDTASASAKTTGFQGSVQQLAIWSRKLSDQEVMEAFGMPRPVIFRTGFDNDSSGEFGGTRSGAAQTIDGLGSWQGVCNEMRAGDSWTVNFDALAGDKNNPEIFSMRTLRGSSAATISASLNGTSLGSRAVNGNSRAFWPVPANLIVAGANTLTLSRTDGGAGDFLVDAMELGGSFLVSGTVEFGRIAKGVPSSLDPNPAHFPGYIRPSQGYSNVFYRVWVDPDASDSCEALLVMSGNRKNGTGTETLSMFVNGTKKTESASDAEWPELRVVLQPGELHGGWNDIEIKTAPDAACFWQSCAYRFDISLTKGFSIPPFATTIIMR